MSNKFWNEWLYSAGEMVTVGVMALLIGLFNGWRIGSTVATRSIQDKATSAGVAQWTIDPQTGVMEFRFIHPASGKESPK